MKKFNKYTNEIKQTVDYGDSTATTIIVRRSNGDKSIDVDEIHNLVDGIEDGARRSKQNVKVMIRAMTPSGMFTFKTYKGVLNIEDFEQYLEGRVSSTAKFEKCAYVEVTILKEKPPVNVIKRENAKRAAKKNK